MVGSLEGGLLDVVVNAAGWTFVAWVATRQPSVLLIALPAAAVVGLLVGSLVSCTSGAFLGTLAFWAFGRPARSPRRRFSFRLLDELVRDELSKKILIFLLAFPFMLVGVVIVAGAGYLVAGDAGAGIGAVAGMLLGVLCALRYFDRIYTRLTSGQLLVLAVLAVVVSLTWESVPGGFTVALTLYFAVGVGLLVWGRQKR